jgi:hypothetical protein
MLATTSEMAVGRPTFTGVWSGVVMGEQEQRSGEIADETDGTSRSTWPFSVGDTSATRGQVGKEELFVQKEKKPRLDQCPEPNDRPTRTVRYRSTS